MPEVSKLVFTNQTDHDIKICLEPWAHEYRVRKGARAEIFGDGQISSEEISIFYHENFIEVWGWSESMRLLIDGQEQEMDFNKS